MDLEPPRQRDNSLIRRGGTVAPTFAPTIAPLARLLRRPWAFASLPPWFLPQPALRPWSPLASFVLFFLGGVVVLGAAAAFFALPGGLQPLRGVSLRSLGLALLAALVCALGLFLLLRAVFARDGLEDDALDLDVAPARGHAGVGQRRHHLRLLGLAEDAAEEEIRRAFRDLVRRCHPDLHPDDPRAAALFRKAMAARDALLGGQG